MEPSSNTADEIARTSLAETMKRIRRVGQNTIAQAVGLSPATISRFCSEDAQRVCDILAAAGLRVVPIERVMVKRHTYESLVTLAVEGLKNPETARKMIWEEL